MLFAFPVTRQHLASTVKQSGSNMPPCGSCLPHALLVYWEVWDTPEAGPRSVEGLGTGVTLQTLLCYFILGSIAHFGRNAFAER